MSDSVRPHRQQPTRLPRPWDSPGKSTGVGAHIFLQGIIPTQGLNPGLLHCRQILYHLSQQRSMYVVLCFLSQCQINYAAAAKSIQSCPTLCNPMDCSLPGFYIHGIFQATVLEWGAIAFSKINYKSSINQRSLQVIRS